MDTKSRHTGFAIAPGYTATGPSDLAVDDPVLPVQHKLGQRFDATVSGEKALMLAVLEDALHCFRGEIGADGHPSSLVKMMVVRKEAGDWLFADEWSWPFSFVNICQSLDIDAAALRSKLCEDRPLRLPRKHKRQGGARTRVVPKPDRQGRRPKSKYFTLGRGE